VPLRHPSVVRTLGLVTRRGVPLSQLASSLVGIIEREIGRDERRRGRAALMSRIA
jgi:hypothetical protein